MASSKQQFKFITKQEIRTGYKSQIRASKVETEKRKKEKNQVKRNKKSKKRASWPGNSQYTLRVRSNFFSNIVFSILFIIINDVVFTDNSL